MDKLRQAPKKPNQSPSMKFLAAAMTDLPPKMFRAYKDSAHRAYSGYRVSMNCRKSRELIFDDENKLLVQSLGFIASLFGTRRSFSTDNIQKNFDLRSKTRRSLSQVQLFSKESFAYKLDAIEEFGNNSSIPNLSEECSQGTMQDNVKTCIKIAQVQYLRQRLLEIFQEIVRFSVYHQNYLNDLEANSNENEDRYERTDSNGMFVIYCKQGLDIADIDQMNGRYITTFNRILRVYKWLRDNEEQSTSKIETECRKVL